MQPSSDQRLEPNHRIAGILRAVEVTMSADTPFINRRIRQLRFDAQSIDPIAETLDGAAGNAPFRLPNATVYQITVPGKDGRPATLLTLWPSIRRVDAINQTSTVVFTDIVTVDVVQDIEVQFRRGNRALLIVARGGKVIVRS
jgi:hypothetical protein